MAMGRNMQGTLNADPELNRAYRIYRDCRTQVLFRHEYTKGEGKNAKSFVAIVNVTTGYHHLPVEGGILDQPHRLMDYFDAFRFGDARAAHEQMG
jgi:hypothetical protein